MGEVSAFMLFLEGSKLKNNLRDKKENRDIAKCYIGLFLLFSLFIVLFWSFRHDTNLKNIIEANLYLKFAKR
jgi:hypothetical protein